MPKRVIVTDRLMRPIAHFSHAVRVGRMIHVGATAGTDATRRVAGASEGLIDVAAQTRKMFENVEIVLGLLGARLDDTVRVKTYIADMRDLPIYREIYGSQVRACKPSHAVVGSWGFPLPQAAIELDLVAAVDEPRESIASARLPAPTGFCAQAGVRVGGHHYCTARPLDATGRVAAEDAPAQCEATLGNLAEMLSAAGLRPSDVVNLHVTLADARDFLAFEAAFRHVFQTPYPSRTIVIAPLESEEMLVQVEATGIEGGGQSIHGQHWPAMLGCASPAVLAGDELYVSGQLGAGASGDLAGGVEAQTRAAWKRIGVLLGEAGMGVESVVRSNNVLTDWRLYGGFNAGYGANVTLPYPPRATVLGGLLAPLACVQIEVLAHRLGDAADVVTVPGAAGM